MTKKLYWLKMHKDFFKSKDIKKLRKISGGDTFTIIYLKMMLLSIDNGGNIAYEGIEPTFSEELALELDEDAVNVNATLLFLQNMGLISEDENDQHTLNHVEQIIGSETPQAGYMRKKRDVQNQILTEEKVTLLQPVTKVLQQSKRIELENRVRDKSKIKDIRHKHGEYKNVLLTDTQLEKLKLDFNNYNEMIKNLDEYIETTGRKYKNHNLVMRKWASNTQVSKEKATQFTREIDIESLMI